MRSALPRALYFIAIPMALIAASTLYPVLFILNISLKTRREYVVDRFAIVNTLNFENFQQVWESSAIDLYFLNSVITTGGAVILLLLFSSMAGFAFALMRFRIRRVLFFLCLSGMMIPVQVILFPFQRLIINMGLLNTRIGLIISFTAFLLPFSMYLMTAFYSGVPRDIIEAAQMDGASLWQVYRRIMLPIGKPALISVGILNTLFTWNDILLPLVVAQARDSRTLMVGISTLRGEFTSNIPLFAAGIILAMLPVVIVFAVFQKQMATGITAGAVKN